MTGALTIPNSVTKIGDDAFHGCHSFTGALTIGNSVTEIGESAFSFCYGLTSLTIGNSVTSIGEKAFDGCSGLKGALTIPSSVTTIGQSAFRDCSSLTGALTIPNSVTEISDKAFYNCNGLRSLTLGNSVKTIGQYAFYECFLGGTLTIPDSVKSIGAYAFYFCSFTGALTIPNSVESIGASAFYYNDDLTAITIGYSVKSIGSKAFYKCSNVASITSLNPTPPKCSADLVFEGIDKTICPLYAPSGSKTAYAGADVWKDFTNIIELDPIAVESITFDKEQASLLEGSTITITYAIAPITATVKALEWSVSDPTIASVVDNNDGTATVTAISEGEATITARSTDGSNITASCAIKSIVLASSLNISVDKPSVAVGSTATITYSIMPENATTKTLEWSVSDPAIASVVDNNDGTATISALSVGEVTITARTTDGSDLTATCSIKTFVLATSLTLSAERLELPVGQSEVIYYTILPETATGKGVAWKSSDPTVASILYNTDGTSITVVAKSEGEATITARTTDGSDLTASCEVKILPPLASSLTLSAEQLAMNVGDHEVITYTILPEDAGDKSVAWTSSEPRRVSISTNADGSVMVNALAIGEATITARTLDGSDLTASCVVKVGSAAVDDVDAEGIEIIATAEGIVVKGAPADSVIDVYTASGVLVYHGYDSLIAIRNHGIYLVCVAGVKVKVAL